MTKKQHPQAHYAFWQFCDVACCTASAPDINLGLIHKNFYKHPQRHQLRAAWVVERAMHMKGIRLDLEQVIAASKREEEDLRNANSRTIASITLR